MKTSAGLLCLAISLFLTAGCSSSNSSGGAGGPLNPSGAPPASKLALKSFSGATACSDLEAYLASAFTEQLLTPFRCFGFGPCPDFVSAPPPLTPDGATDNGAAAPERISGTNVQEAGVDEADLLKVDAAGRLYVVTGQRLVILPAFPPEGLEAREQATVELRPNDPAFVASELFLDEDADRAVVLGNRFDGTGSRAVAVLIDISDPTQPQRITERSVDGFGIDARRVGNRIHRVARFQLPVPAALFDDEGLQQRIADYYEALSAGRDAEAAAVRQDVIARVRNTVAGIGTAALLPKRYDDDVATPLACSDIAAPEVPFGIGFAVLQSLDTDGDNHAASAAINNAYLLYASPRNLYLAQNSSGWFFSFDQPDESVIYRFAMSETGAPEYRGFGRTPGSLPGRFAMSEFDNHLRVASTELSFDGNRFLANNHLEVLRLNATDMPRVGALPPFAPDESIRGVRFLGERAFVVTFEEIDPLFAIDLSRPEQPEILGELKIPGFSSYLSPAGDDFLLTIGRAGDDQGLSGKLAIQLFDVRDLGDIKQHAIIEPDIGDDSFSYSLAEYEPRAFTYFPDSAEAPVPGLLSVPLRASGAGGDFSGFVVVRVDPLGERLRETGRIDHGELSEQQDCYQGGGHAGGSNPGSGGPEPGFAEPDARPCGVFDANPLRTVFMQDAQGTYLYSLSALGIVASDANDPTVTLGRARLPQDATGGCCYLLDADDSDDDG